MRRRRWVYVGLFALGIGLPVAAGLFSKGVSKGEGAKAVLRFTQAPASSQIAIVDIARFGALKATIQPWRFRIYVRIENASESPRRVRVTLEGCRLPISWYSRDYTWDEERDVLDEPLAPGKRFGIYLFVSVPEELRERSRLCDGKLQAVDGDTGALLTTGRLQIVNSSLGGLSPEGAVGHEGGHDHDGALHN